MNLFSRTKPATRDIRADQVTVGMTIYRGDSYEMSNVSRHGEVVTAVNHYREGDQDLVGITGRRAGWAWNCAPNGDVRVAEELS